LPGAQLVEQSDRMLAPVARQMTVVAVSTPVSERGWTPDEHEEWLADLLCARLLRADTPRG
jgi:hypothetical protein